MNPDYCATSPTSRSQDIEWAFVDGDPAIVAHVPDGAGSYEAIRLDHLAPADRHRREFVKALLRLAQWQMDETEPATTTGAPA